MKIIITGSPSTSHRTIARAIASRLNLQYFSAADIAMKVCLRDGLAYDDFRKHDNDILDYKVNDELYTTLQNLNDFVLDSACASMFIDGAYTIFLHSEIIGAQTPLSFLRATELEESFTTNIMKEDHTKSSLYDLYIDVTGCDKDSIINFVIESIQTGYKGEYVSKYLLVPAEVTNIYPSSRKVDFTIGKYYSTYMLLDNFDEAVHDLHEHGFIKASGGVRFLADVVPRPIEEYKAWFAFVKPTDLIKLSILFSRYCKANDILLPNDAFLRLSVSGDPMSKLSAIS